MLVIKTPFNALLAITSAIRRDAGFYPTQEEWEELRAVLEAEGVPESAADCRALVMGVENETGSEVPARLIAKHPKLHAWLDNLLT